MDDPINSPNDSTRRLPIELDANAAETLKIYNEAIIAISQLDATFLSRVDSSTLILVEGNIASSWQIVYAGMNIHTKLGDNFNNQPTALIKRNYIAKFNNFLAHIAEDQNFTTGYSVKTVVPLEVSDGIYSWWEKFAIQVFKVPRFDDNQYYLFNLEAQDTSHLEIIKMVSLNNEILLLTSQLGIDEGRDYNYLHNMLFDHLNRFLESMDVQEVRVFNSDFGELNVTSMNPFYYVPNVNGKSRAQIGVFNGDELICLYKIDFVDRNEISRDLLPFINNFIHNISLVYSLLSLHQDQEHSSESFSKTISYVLHQLNSPLTSINLKIDLIDRYMRGKEILDDRTHEMFESIITLTADIAQLIRDVNLFYKIQMGIYTPSVDTVDNVNNFFDKIVKKVQDIYPTTQVLINGGDFGAMIDTNVFSHIIHNLVENAAKYSQNSEGEIAISIKQIDKNLKISIQDNGIGIPPNDINKIFDSLYRANNTTGYKGSGTGLELVKWCVKTLGGEISVKSEEGLGSTFTVSVPLLDFNEL
ncbi:HAMP domain-containing histidine kinase [Candidatus Dojkabacteria bacterium]|uniref:histidine kinase n=1 Tax=Candidatus Dojkabacteria bacterium TaxID=2099670 RepID=A0A955IA63_9BACT|nr:HAMP domain-containing histidine kinase [Candidatus Dojkabacteria bacterium]